MPTKEEVKAALVGIRRDNHPQAYKILKELERNLLTKEPQVRRAILATRSGWTFAATIERETPKTFHLMLNDSGKPRLVSKGNHLEKVFEAGTYDSISEIEHWIYHGDPEVTQE